MKILLASSEVYPYSKTGGLADAVGALGKALAKAGHEVGIVTPLYRGIREKFPALQRTDWVFDLPLGDKRVGGEVWTHNPSDRLTVYFIRHDFYFDRAGIYNERSGDYSDNGERFIYFSKCVVNLARYLPMQPELVHAADWQTGLVPLMILHGARAEGWGNAPRTCFTIHNLAYQGVFPSATYALADLSAEFFHSEGAEHFGWLNCLKAGIAFADVVTTVSPRYAREITTQEFGEGLDGLLRKRQGQGRLIGILNGVDYDEWNTTKNRWLAAPYSLDDLSGKAVNKVALQQELSLPIRANAPVFGTVTRLADQKGVDIELGALEEMLSADVQFVLLGSGSREHELAFEKLAKRYPDKVGLRIGYDHGLAHRIEAGSDFYIMPSRFEPCGLNQMYSLRYGTIPIVRRTGGLDDSVIDAGDDAERTNGIKFNSYSASALAKAIRKAMVVFANQEVRIHYQHNGMAADFSWDRIVDGYLRTYQLRNAT
jgi:starch synthase